MKALTNIWGDKYLAFFKEETDPEEVKAWLEANLDNLKLEEAYSCTVHYAVISPERTTFIISGDDDNMHLELNDIVTVN
jgi:hypothetical protein